MTTGRKFCRQEKRQDKDGISDVIGDKLPFCENNCKDVRKEVKRAHTISGRTFVVIADVIVYKLGINEDTWFEQQVIDNGIFLRMCKL